MMTNRDCLVRNRAKVARSEGFEHVLATPIILQFAPYLVRMEN
jgi:hypothetical protein